MDFNKGLVVALISIRLPTMDWFICESNSDWLAATRGSHIQSGSLSDSLQVSLLFFFFFFLKAEFFALSHLPLSFLPPPPHAVSQQSKNSICPRCRNMPNSPRCRHNKWKGCLNNKKLQTGCINVWWCSVHRVVDDVFTYEVLKKKYYSSENTLIAQVYLINWIIWGKMGSFLSRRISVPVVTLWGTKVKLLP